MGTKTIRFLFLVLLLTSCASRPTWLQEGKTSTDTERDFNDCYAEAKRKFGTNLESPLFTIDVKQCMESRGYKQIRIEDRTPESPAAPVPRGM